LTPLQVHIIAGPTAGQRLQLNTSPISFGRAPESALVLDLPVVSRNHGELRCEEDGTWVLVNHSQNGTRLNRKRVTTKPRPIPDGASVVIGDEEVFRISFVGSGEDAGYNNDDESAAAAVGPTGGKNRNKLWLGLGIWFAICIGLFVFFATLGGGNNDDKPARGGIIELTSVDQVRDMLDTPIDQATPDNRAYTEHVTRAREAYKRGDITDMYDVYTGYREAQRYLEPGRRLDPIDQQQLNAAEDRLVEEVYKLYTTAYNKLGAGQYLECVRVVDQFYRIYPISNVNNPLVRSIQQIRERASSRLN